MIKSKFNEYNGGSLIECRTREYYNDEGLIMIRQVKQLLFEYNLIKKSSQKGKKFVVDTLK